MRLLQTAGQGNVRELQNATERALILAQQGAMQFDLPVQELLDQFATRPNPGSGSSALILTDLELQLGEKENMLTAPNQTAWRINGDGGAAELLGVKPTTLISRLKSSGSSGRGQQPAINNHTPPPSAPVQPRHRIRVGKTGFLLGCLSLG
jgi:transcriptional regulator of acetoin/glycerol metabolism